MHNFLCGVPHSNEEEKSTRNNGTFHMLCVLFFCFFVSGHLALFASHLSFSQTSHISLLLLILLHFLLVCVVRALSSYSEPYRVYAVHLCKLQSFIYLNGKVAPILIPFCIRQASSVRYDADAELLDEREKERERAWNMFSYVVWPPNANVATAAVQTHTPQGAISRHIAFGAENLQTKFFYGIQYYLFRFVWRGMALAWCAIKTARGTTHCLELLILCMWFAVGLRWLRSAHRRPQLERCNKWQLVVMKRALHFAWPICTMHVVTFFGPSGRWYMCSNHEVCCWLLLQPMSEWAVSIEPLATHKNISYSIITTSHILWAYVNWMGN